MCLKMGISLSFIFIGVFSFGIKIIILNKLVLYVVCFLILNMRFE